MKIEEIGEFGLIERLRELVEANRELIARMEAKIQAKKIRVNRLLTEI